MFNISYVLQKGSTLKQLDRLESNVKRLLSKEVSVGFFAGTRNNEGKSIPNIARKNEYGDPSKRVPARPFMAITVSRAEGAMLAAMARIARDVVRGGLEATTALNRLGRSFATAIRTTILSNVPPPNTPRTVALKGSSRTLIDTGQMLRAVTYRLRTRKP